MRSLLALACASSLMLAGCASAPPLPASNAAPGTSLRDIYRLGAGDRFRLTVFNEPNLTGQEYAVGAEGEASLPLIGALKLGGMTAREAEAAIAARYAGGYINNPRVNIEVVTSRPFYILGEVNKPGQYPFSDGMTVLKAVALAEGFTYRASNRKVYIKRADQGAEAVVKLAADTPVLPGDTIRIVERFF